MDDSKMAITIPLFCSCFGYLKSAVKSLSHRQNPSTNADLLGFLIILIIILALLSCWLIKIVAVRFFFSFKSSWMCQPYLHYKCFSSTRSGSPRPRCVRARAGNSTLWCWSCDCQGWDVLVRALSHYPATTISLCLCREELNITALSFIFLGSKTLLCGLHTSK